MGSSWREAPTSASVDPQVGSVSRGPHHLGAQHRLVETELAVELLDGVRLRGQLDDGVDALGVLLDLVGQATPTPYVDVLDAAAVLADDVEVLVEGRLYRPLLETRAEDDHHFIFTHSGLHLLWTRAATDSPWQEGFALHGVRRGSSAPIHRARREARRVSVRSHAREGVLSAATTTQPAATTMPRRARVSTTR